MGNRWTSERRHATMTPSKNSESGGGAKVGWNDDKSSTAPELRTCAVTEPIGSVSRQLCSEITPTDGDIRRITIYRSYSSKMAPPPEAETELRPNRSSSTGARFETDVWRSLGHAYKLYKPQGTRGGSVAEWLACLTQAQNGPGSNRIRDAVG